ncbi:MAG: hypothetical protein KDB63_14025 [Nocardioidaceae bacterium]|nr:hypothetical protein [Nocardioidaceae bacterium]
MEDAADVVREIMNDPNQSGRDRLAAAAHVMKLLGMEKERHEVTVSVDPIEDLFRRVLTAPGGLDSATPGSALESPEIAALNARADPQAIVEAEATDVADVVDVEWVEQDPDPDDAHTVHVAESMSSRPPKHIREALERLI